MSVSSSNKRCSSIMTSEAHIIMKLLGIIPKVVRLSVA